MAGKERIRNVDVKLKTGAFTALLRRFTEQGRVYKGVDLTEISALRRLLSNERARMIYTIQQKKPSSIYELAKFLGRDFKSVRGDIELLRGFGLIRFVSEAHGKKKCKKPVLTIDRLQINLRL